MKEANLRGSVSNPHSLMANPHGPTANLRDPMANLRSPVSNLRGLDPNLRDPMANLRMGGVKAGSCRLGVVPRVSLVFRAFRDVAHMFRGLAPGFFQHPRAQVMT